MTGKRPENLNEISQKTKAEPKYAGAAFASQPTGDRLSQKGDQTQPDNCRHAREYRLAGQREFARTRTFGQMAVDKSCSDALEEAVGQPPESDNQKGNPGALAVAVESLTAPATRVKYPIEPTRLGPITRLDVS